MSRDEGIRPARLRVGVISAGRVGAVLGAALARAGHTVTGVSAVSTASLNRAENLLPGVPVLPPDQVAVDCDLLLLAIPDDRLPGMVKGLVAAGVLRPGQIIVHTSGAHGVAVLAPTIELGLLPLALHPAMTFGGRDEDLTRLASCCIGVTATEEDEAAWHVGEALVVEMGAEPVRIPERARPLYHAALAHGSNHLITLVNDCTKLLASAGIASPSRLLGPLLSASLDNSLRHADRALTGPVARGDAGTVATHIQVLRDAEPELLPSYVALAKRTAQRAEESGQLRHEAADEVLHVLDQENR
ncbi:DUF2520 domain-containing protein [Pseudonocardiaceae bacterium YIM PH 21723]|nr:DUF2520 domain-containing protein [Pseudonocardiaceae bacterium YIM PH 21723]